MSHGFMKSFSAIMLDKLVCLTLLLKIKSCYIIIDLYFIDYYQNAFLQLL